MHKTLLITVSQTTVPKIKLKNAFMYSWSYLPIIKEEELRDLQSYFVLPSLEL